MTWTEAWVFAEDGLVLGDELLADFEPLGVLGERHVVEGTLRGISSVRGPIYAEEDIRAHWHMIHIS